MGELFGAYLRARRMELDLRLGGYSIRKLAQRLRVHHSFLSRIERGEPARLCERKLVALAYELGENPDLILAMNGTVAEDVRRAILKRPALFSRLVRELRDAPDEDVRADSQLRRERTRLAQRIADKAVRLRRALDELRVFRLAVDNGPAAVCMIGPDDSVTYVNRAFLTLWGFTSETDILGRHRSVFWVDPEEAQHYYRKMKETGRSSMEARALRPDGTTFLARVTATACLDLDGRVVGGIASIVDVTRERALERGLASSNQWLRQFVEDMHDVLLLLDDQGRVVYVSPSLETVWDLEPQAVQGRPLAAFALPAHKPMLRDQIARTLEGANTIGDHRLLHGDGTYPWVRLSLAPRRDEQGRVTGAQGVVAALNGRVPPAHPSDQD
ncbi:PAS domain S-box protein [Desulfovibrio aminophilus]|uniref:PAS domain S-box protein n=1 Tax=Desulfovibrio aminophilus TaxID=81425 RepID=UPI003393FF04